MRPIKPAVDRLRAAGVRFAITSGRPPRGMAMLVGPLRLESPIAAFNGGMFVKPDLTTVIEQRTLPRLHVHNGSRSNCRAES
jgi:hydroxymethylpyrimidine pyrophosphatase-like HAD family hydrolase